MIDEYESMSYLSSQYDSFNPKMISIFIFFKWFVTEIERYFEEIKENPTIRKDNWALVVDP